MAEEKRVPKIRFKGFDEEWELRKFGDVFREYSEKNHDELPPLMIVQGGGTLKRDESERNLTYDKANLSNYKKVDEGDFIVHLRSFEGGLEIATNTGIISPAYHTFHGENTDSTFYYSLFRSRKFIDADLKPHVYGIRDGRSIDIEGMKTIQIPNPDYKEQKIIGELIASLDETISYHQQKYESLQRLKETMLEKMFPKDGADVPEIRFKGFSGAWVHSSIDTISTLNPPSTLPDVFEYVDLESVVGTELLSHRTETKESAPSRAQRLAKTGDVFYQTVRPYQKNNFLYNLPYDNYVFSTGYAQIRPIIDSYYLLYLLQNDRVVSRVLEMSTGTGYPAINSENLSRIEISFPECVDEQKMIGNYFKELDKTIIKHKEKLKQLSTLKKALLEKMFV